MNGPRLLIRTPSRLHFGLLGWGPESDRQFGGLGLMIDRPAIKLIAEKAPEFDVQGPLAERVRRILEKVRDRLSGQGNSLPPMRIQIVEAPPEHVGLGVGTQLSLAIAATVFQLAGNPVPPVEELARLTGRGQRSGIGLHGFERGGLIVDGGRRAEGEVPPLVARLDFPGDWSIVVIQPPGKHGLNGPEEIRAFQELPSISPRLTEKLCRIVLLNILPSIARREIEGFGAGLEELQTHVGATFAPAQGGSYSSPRAPEIIGALHCAGFMGCGQSSWGPTLYGFSDKPGPIVGEMVERVRNSQNLEASAVIVTGAANRGATLERPAHGFHGSTDQTHGSGL